MTEPLLKIRTSCKGIRLNLIFPSSEYGSLKLYTKSDTFRLRKTSGAYVMYPHPDGIRGSTNEKYGHHTFSFQGVYIKDFELSDHGPSDVQMFTFDEHGLKFQFASEFTPQRKPFEKNLKPGTDFSRVGVQHGKSGAEDGKRAPREDSVVAMREKGPVNIQNIQGADRGPLRSVVNKEGPAPKKFKRGEEDEPDQTSITKIRAAIHTINDAMTENPDFEFYVFDGILKTRLRSN